MVETEQVTGTINIPGYSGYQLASFVFTDYSTIQTFNPPGARRFRSTIVTGGDKAVHQDIGVAPGVIRLTGRATSQSNLDEVRSAVRSSGNKRFYFQADRFYHCHPGTVTENKNAKNPNFDSFTITFPAADSFQYSHAVTTESGGFTTLSSGEEASFDLTGGKAYTWTKIEITATDELTNMVITDGTRTMTYTGTIGAGEKLTIGDYQGTVTANIDGTDKTGFLSGDMVRLEHDVTNELTFTTAGGDAADIDIKYRKRWY